MAVTVASAEIIPRQRVGQHYETKYRLTLTGTYDTNGLAVTAANLGLSQIKDVMAMDAWTGTTALNSVWDSTNSKIKLFETAGTVDLPHKELSNATTVTNYTIDVTARGL